MFHVNRHKVLYQMKGNGWQKHSVQHSISSYLLSTNRGLLVTAGSAAHKTKLICYVAQNSVRSCICTVSSFLEHNLLHVSANNRTERHHWLRDHTGMPRAEDKPAPAWTPDLPAPAAFGRCFLCSGDRSHHCWVQTAAWWGLQGVNSES